MGGHGGLNILPQKRWNVYNWDNRERVRKDEQEAARQQQEQEQQQRDLDAHSRLDKLRANARGGLVVADDSGHVPRGHEQQETDSAPALSCHDQLLELFEEKSVTKKRREDKEREKDKQIDKERRRETRKKQADDGEAKYRLGGVQSASRPWYLQLELNTSVEEDAELHRSSSGGGNKRKKSVEELRAERLKREECERAKARRLLPSGSIGGSQCYNSGFGNRQRM